MCIHVEILFTWRTPSSSSGTESFDILVNGKKITSFHQPGVGEDFFSKFVSSEPVSPTLRTSLKESFQDIFASDSPPLAEDLSDQSDMPHPSQLSGSSALPQCKSYSNALGCFRKLREKRPSLLQEMYASLFVLFYCCLLITQSLPSRAKYFRVIKLRDRLTRLNSSFHISAAQLAMRIGRSQSALTEIMLLTSDSVGPLLES